MTPAELVAVAEAARRALTFELQRNTYNPHFMRMAIAPFLQTYDADPAQGRPLLEQLLAADRIGIYGRYEFQPIAYAIDRVHNPEALELIYRTVFGEISLGEGKVPIGQPSVVMSMVQDASQTLQAARYYLATAFNRILNEHPRLATRMLAFALERVQRANGVTATTHFTASLNGAPIRLDHDGSNWLDKTFHHHKDWWKMVEAFAAKLRATLEANDTGFFFEAADELRTATTGTFLWRVVLANAGVAPASASAMLPFAISPDVLASYEFGSPLADYFGDALSVIDTASRGIAADAFVAFVDACANDERIRDHRIDRIREYLRSAPPDMLAASPALMLLAQDRQNVSDTAADDDEEHRALALDGGYVSPVSMSHIPISDAAKNAGASPDLIAAIAAVDLYFLNQPRSLSNLARPVLEVVRTLDECSRDALPAARESALAVATQLLLDAFSQGATFTSDELREIGTLTIAAAQMPSIGATTPAERAQREADFANHPSWGATARINASALLWNVYHAEPYTAALDALRGLIDDDHPAVRHRVAERAWVARNTDPTVASEFIEHAFRDWNMSVWIAALNSASLMPPQYQERYDEMVLEGYDRMLQDDEPSGERRAGLLRLILEKSFVTVEPNATARVQRLIEDPWASVPMTRTLIMELSNQVSSQLPIERRRPAAALLMRLVVSLRDDLDSLQRPDAIKLTPDETTHMGTTIKMLMLAAERLYYASDVMERMPPTSAISDTGEIDRESYELLRPLLAALGALSIPTASYHVLKTLAGAVDTASRDVLLLGCATVMSAVQNGLASDGLAEDDVRAFVMRYVLDHRGLLEDDRECLAALMDVVDAFVNAGYPKWFQVVGELDGIYRAS